MCKADVTGSFVPCVAKQMQSVDPVGHIRGMICETNLDSDSNVAQVFNFE